jgi:D-glycerate 3-kinase
MKLTVECFDKVKKDCLKFIKSQETKADKFKNKERMIKSFLIPLCFWINKKAENKRPYFVGLAGGQGTGKTTISALIRIILTKYFRLNVFRISIDDFYKTRKERINLSKRVHPMLLTRGVPGTHDVNMMLNFFKNSKSKKFKRSKLPTFNKAIDDRYNKKKWYDLKKKPDVIIFEGWCVGAKSEKNTSLKKTINSMEKIKDQKQIWRKYVNDQLKSKYKKLYSQLNCLVYLKAKNFSLLQKWRLKQERKLWLNSKKKSNLKIMSRGDVLNFMQTYQRITQNMFRYMPKYATVILNLNTNHQIKSAVYKKR